MINKYPKSRIILTCLLFLYWAWLIYELYFLGFGYVNWFPFLILFAGSVLFTFNKILTDIISFFVFLSFLIFSIIGIYEIYKLLSEGISFWEYVSWQLSTVMLNISGIMLLLILVIYISYTFFKRSKLIDYK